MREDQYSVFQWIEESFPGASMDRRIKHLFEEVTELAIALNPDMDVAKLQAIIAHTADKARQQHTERSNIGAEIADVRISISGIASAADIDEQNALDNTMAINRQRNLAVRQQREAAKQSLPIFQP